MVDKKGSHSDLTPDYAAIPAEMKSAAACFGKTLLSQVGEAEFYSHIPAVRAATGDRAVLRAMHFFAENARVLKEANALKAGDFEAFRKLVLESGRSSFQYLQNVYSPSHVSEQGVSVALALCEKLLANRGGAVGVTMPHPHGQIYGYPFLPKKLELEVMSAKEHYEQTGHCLYCDYLKDEKDEKKRIIFQNEYFTVFLPFFSAYPYGVYIQPNAHKPYITKLYGGREKVPWHYGTRHCRYARQPVRLQIPLHDVYAQRTGQQRRLFQEFSFSH